MILHGLILELEETVEIFAQACVPMFKVSKVSGVSDWQTLIFPLVGSAWSSRSCDVGQVIKTKDQDWRITLVFVVA